MWHSRHAVLMCLVSNANNGTSPPSGYRRRPAASFEGFAAEPYASTAPQRHWRAKPQKPRTPQSPENFCRVLGDGLLRVIKTCRNLSSVVFLLRTRSKTPCSTAIRLQCQFWAHRWHRQQAAGRGHLILLRSCLEWTATKTQFSVTLCELTLLENQMPLRSAIKRKPLIFTKSRAESSIPFTWKVPV